MKSPKEKAQATLVIYRGLPFAQKFVYSDADGRVIDLTGKKAELTLRASAGDPAALYTFSTANGKIVLGLGSIDVSGMTDVETAALTWQEAVGHLVIEEIVGRPLPMAYFLFEVRDSTSGVPA